MSKVVVDDALCEKLTAGESFTELCGTDGRTVGFFVKPGVHAQLLRGWAGSEVTADELEQARQEYRQRGGRTLAEVFAELRRRGIPGVPAE